MAMGCTQCVVTLDKAFQWKKTKRTKGESTRLRWWEKGSESVLRGNSVPARAHIKAALSHNECLYGNFCQSTLSLSSVRWPPPPQIRHYNSVLCVQVPRRLLWLLCGIIKLLLPEHHKSTIQEKARDSLGPAVNTRGWWLGSDWWPEKRKYDGSLACERATFFAIMWKVEKLNETYHWFHVYSCRFSQNYRLAHINFEAPVTCVPINFFKKMTVQ